MIKKQSVGKSTDVKEKKHAMFRGNKPKGERWRLASSRGDWDMWSFDNFERFWDDKDQVAVKFVLRKGKARKANYNLRWSRNLGRFVKSENARIAGEQGLLGWMTEEARKHIGVKGQPGRWQGYGIHADES